MLEAVRDADFALLRAIHLGWRSSLLDPLFWVLSYTGLGQIQLAALALAAWRRPAVRPRLPYLLGAFAASGILNSVLKDLFDRERPSLVAWTLPQEPFRFGSFPSGHTVTSFALAVCAALMLRDRRGWPLILWAVGVALSRVYRGVHWPSDVLAAAALGSVVGAAFAWLAEVRLARRAAS
ncbi:MAG: phosphatase PAP2 family protein [Fimbriimonadaceae bacterium]